MSDQERIAVEELVRSGPDLASGSVDEVRAAYEGMGAITPLAANVSVEPAVLGGVPGEFIRPAGSATGALIVFFHGGGYMIGSLATHRGLASLLAVAAGVTVFSVEYRLAPEHPFPAASDDALAVYQSLLDIHGGAMRIAFAGDSAGGGLALATLMRIRDAGLEPPAAAFLMSPFVDLAGTGESVEIKAGVDVVVQPSMIAGMGECYLAGQPATTPLASPIYGEFHDLPPLLIHVGTYECILDDSIRLARKAALKDVAVELKVWPRQAHVFQLFSGMLEEGRQSLVEAGAYLRSHLV